MSNLIPEGLREKALAEIDKWFQVHLDDRVGDFVFATDLTNNKKIMASETAVFRKIGQDRFLVIGTHYGFKFLIWFDISYTNGCVTINDVLTSRMAIFNTRYSDLVSIMKKEDTDKYDYD